MRERGFHGRRGGPVRVKPKAVQILSLSLLLWASIISVGVQLAGSISIGASDDLLPSCKHLITTIPRIMCPSTMSCTICQDT